MGHTGSTSYFIGGKLGKLVGSKEEHDTEKLSLPKQLGFFKDVNVSTALVIGIIMLISMAFADQGVLAEQAAGYNADIHPWVWGIVSALRFAAGIAILLFGVRMFLAEIVPAFKGISDKVLPGTRPALDVPTVFPYAPTAVMLGFLSAIVVFLITMIIFASIGWFVLVPSMIMLFFIPAGAAVFGNATGGWRGAVLAGGLAGLFLAVGQAITWPMLSSTAPELATLADPDWYILAWLISLLNIPFAGMNPSAGIWIVTALIVVIFAILLVILKRTVSRVEEEPAGEAPFSREETSPPTEEDLS
jgi:PTS system ascorbate-specific IIC component